MWKWDSKKIWTVISCYLFSLLFYIFDLFLFYVAGTIHVQYKPSHSGVYKLNIKFGEIPVVGSPFVINVN